MDTDTVNTGGHLSRRRALGLLAGSGAALIAGCSTPSSGSAGPKRSALPLPTRPTPSGTPTAPQAADWKALTGKVQGAVRRPGQSGYTESHRLFDPRFDNVHPRAVVAVASDADVAQAIAFAKRYDLPLSIRSGGHSYLGASTGEGLVIDLRALNSVEYSHRRDVATVGAGAALIDVYSRLAAKGIGIAAGSCPSVGISGLTLGGGVGVLARKYGLTCDQLIAATVVTAEGISVTANGNSASGLFYALRGGGGSFGVATSLVFSSFAAPSLSHAYVEWPWSQSTAGEVLAAWQQFATTAPDELWSTCHLVANSSRSQAPTLAVAAVYVGESQTLDELLNSLVSMVPAAPRTRSVNDDSFESTMMLEAGCSDLTVAACHVAAETPGGTLPRGAFVAGSDFFADLIPTKGITAIVSAVEARATDPALSSGGVSFDVLGGAVDHATAGGAAYAHRGALFNAQYTANWVGSSNEPLARNLKSLQSMKTALEPYATGGAYPNYADVSLQNAPSAYWGKNLHELSEIRHQFDPKGLFTQPQGVPLPS